MSGRLKLELDEPQRLQIDASTTAFAIGADAVPPADVHLVLDRGALSGNVSLHEEGAPVDASFKLSPGGALAFEAVSDVPSLGAIRGSRRRSRSARVRVAGTLHAGVIDARVNALYSGLHAPGGVSIGYGGLDGHVNGSTSAPGAIDLDATVWGRQMAASGYSFDRVTGSARGPVLHPQVTATLLSHPPREARPRTIRAPTPSASRARSTPRRWARATSSSRSGATGRRCRARWRASARARAACVSTG